MLVSPDGSDEQLPIIGDLKMIVLLNTDIWADELS